MDHLLDNDPELSKYFHVSAVQLELDGSGEELNPDEAREATKYAVIRCKHCARAWEVMLTDGRVGKGERNAVLQHGRVHDGGRPRMKRVT